MRSKWRLRDLESGCLALTCAMALSASAQTAGSQSLAQQVQQLTDALARTQQQLQQSQEQLKQMQDQLDMLKRQMAQAAATNATTPTPAARLAAQVEQLREQQRLQESEIATHDQIKVESGSKYPVKLDGLILLNGFINTQQVDMVATPTIAIGGPGSSGATLRQTWLGVEARGPHLFGASSSGDVSVDFFGSTSPNGNYTGAYNNSVGLLRLHTAHAALAWKYTRTSFAYDRPILSPNAPDSLTAVAIPPLAWSGNLWAWNPQLELGHDFPLSSSHSLRLQAALIDVADPPVPAFPPTVPAPPDPASTAEQSRWPGTEARVAWVSRTSDTAAEFGAGGFFAPHRTSFGASFDSWAGTLDFRQPLPAHFVLTGAFYRGLALGGLGGGAYKDFAARPDLDDPGNIYFRALDDVGGWAELKERLNQRLEFNAAFGLDSVPAGELRPYAGYSNTYYQNLALNRTYTGNIIYTPSAYLLFSLEYRRLESSPTSSPTAASNVIGMAAGYKF